MNAVGVVTSEFQALARAALATIEDYTDGQITVSLVEDAFDPKDLATYPAASAAFAGVNNAAAWQVEYDALSERWFLVAPDPVDGWDFVSLAAGVTIVGFTIEGAADKFSGNMFEVPIPITAIGQHINLPWVAIDITDVIMDALNPYPLV